MIYVAQIDPKTNTIIQGAAFSTSQMAEDHFSANPEHIFVFTDEFITPGTHLFLDGKVVQK